MAQREAGKVRKRAIKGIEPPRPQSGRKAEQSRRSPSQEISRLEQERDALKAELEAAKARIAELERSRELIVNRIDWVIDSLHNLTEE